MERGEFERVQTAWQHVTVRHISGYITEGDGDENGDRTYRYPYTRRCGEVFEHLFLLSGCRTTRNCQDDVANMKSLESRR